MDLGNESLYNSYLKGGGEMGKLTRAFDWSNTALGSPIEWPSSLLTTVNILLNSKFPMFLWWGSDLIQFYNDAYRPSLGINGKHPTALGQKAIDCWQEAWPLIKPLIDQVMSGGVATWNEDQLIPIYRNGEIQDVYWTFSYSRVDDETGNPAGVLVIVAETTGLVQKMKQINEKYYYATLATSDAIWDWNIITETIGWGQGYKTIFGYEEGEIKEAKQSIFANIHPEDIERVLKGLDEAINSQQTKWKDEYRYIKSDQTYVDVIDKGIIIRDADGRATRMVGAMHDITTQKQEEQKLKLVNEKLRDISWMQSHIIRAPLARIMGLIQLIEGTDMSDYEKAKAINNLLVSANELDDVIKNITRISNFEEVDNSEQQNTLFRQADKLNGL